MAGISDHAWNKLPNYFRYQGKEMQNQEFADGTGLEEYDFGARSYGQQIGRWNMQDPAKQFASPYLGMGDSWPNGRDPDGRFFGIDDIVVSAAGLLVGYIGYGLTTHHWGGKALLSGLTGAIVAEGGYLTLGGGLVSTPLAGSCAVGGAGSMEAATMFSSSYVVNEISSFAQYGKQISHASEWGAYGLITGYETLPSFSAGMTSQNSINKLDVSEVIDPKTEIVEQHQGFHFGPGKMSSGVAGFTYRTGNLILGSYDPVKNKWDARIGK